MGACAPLGAYSVTQNCAKNARKHVILTPKIQKFSGDGVRSVRRARQQTAVVVEPKSL